MSTGRPRTSVPHHENTWIPLGITIIRLAAEKKIIEICGRPVANMWCTQTPKPMKAVIIEDMATQVNASSGRRAKVGTIEETITTAGRKMM